MEKANEHKSIYGNWLLQGVALASIPAFAYVLAFIYESGYASYFHIPVSLISISPTLFCASMISLVSLAVAGFLFFNTIYKSLHTFTYKHPGLNRIVSRCSVFITLALLLLIFARVPASTIRIFLLVLVGILALADFVVIPLLKKVNSALDRANQDLVDSLKVHEPVNRLEKILGIKIGWVLVAAVALLFGSFLAGSSMAANQQPFAVQEGSNPLVVLRIYDNVMIMAPFDQKTKKVDRIFFTRPVGNNPDAMIVQENIGPLVPTDN